MIRDPKKPFWIAALALASLSAAHAEDNWQKRKDCTEQAEKFLKANS